MPDLTAHYRDLIADLEAAILARVPRLPLLPEPAGLTDTERDGFAARFAAAHHLTDRDAS